MRPRKRGRRCARASQVATVQGSIPASSDIWESEGAADEAVLNNVHKNIQKIPRSFKKNTLCTFSSLFGLADIFFMDILIG